nr:MAG TPA: hypothetical protein [Bacteriophage sp.]
MFLRLRLCSLSYLHLLPSCKGFPLSTYIIKDILYNAIGKYKNYKVFTIYFFIL